MNMNTLREAREHYLRKTCITTSRMRTRKKMLKLNTVKLGARMCPRSIVPLSDRKNPEYD